MNIKSFSFKLLFLIFIFLNNVCCQSNKDDISMHQALSLAGDNRVELEKVLKHYESDSLKLEAAKFLIRNLPGSFSKNEQIVDICQPFYQEYDLLANLYEYEMNTERGKK